MTSRRMKTPLIFSGAFGLLICGSVFAQGTFQNLKFEEANLVQIPGQPYAVTVANALPDWTVEYGNAQQTQITYNVLSLGGTAATLLVKNYPSPDTTLTPLDGSFSVLLYGGPTPISLSQTGLIPAGTQSLLFEGAWFSGGPGPNVSIGSDNLTLFPVGNGLFGANISAWGGQTEQLSFTVPAGYGPYTFDDISFSPGAVPEPSPVLLTGITAALFGVCRFFSIKWK
jgi:hypothetical protein